MASGGMICVPSCMMIGLGIQGILWLLPERYERLQCWCYLLQRFMKYAAEMASGGMICISVFTKIGTGVQKLEAHTHTHTQTPRWSHKPAFIFRDEEHRLKKGPVCVREGARVVE
jgi:hypothetical protein